MNQQLELLRNHVLMIWLYRWVALAVALILSIGGWGFVYSMPNEYRVSAMIFIDTRSMLQTLLKGMTVKDSMIQNSAGLMQQTLLTRPNLEEVARRTDLDLKTKTPSDFDRLVQELGRNVRLSGTQRNNIFEIRYNNSDPQLAKRVVDELLNTFLESTLGHSRKDKVVTEKFLDEQIAIYEKKLIEAEESLKQFKIKNVGMMPGSQTDYFSRLERAQSDRRAAELMLVEATQRRNEIARQIESAQSGGFDEEEALFGMGGSVDGQATSPEVAQIDSRISGYEQRIDELLLNYTEKHPDIVAMRKTIAELEKRREEALLEVDDSDDPFNAFGPSENPVVQQLKLSLSDAQAVAASLGMRVKEYKRREAELASRVDTIPEVEAELQRLNRDYGLNKAQYSKLLQRRESARLSQSAQETSDDIQLKVIEPPKLPLFPSGPERLRYLLGVAFASLAAGCALAWFLAQLKPRIFSTNELTELFGLPVIGSISVSGAHLRTTRQRVELAALGLGVLALVGAYSGLITLEILGFDLHGRVVNLAERIL